MKEKNSHDINKEKAEEQCFQKAYSEAIKRKDKTAELLAFFYGTPFRDRDKNDRPDIVRICKRGKRNPKEIVVGIEHFRVDQLSVKHKSGYKSTRQEINSWISDIYEAGHKELITEGIASEANTVRLLDNIAKLSMETMQRKYSSLLSSLDYALVKHLKGADAYRKNLEKIASGRTVELAFLIEITSAFPQLFLNDKNRTHVKNDGILPMLDSFVMQLEAIDKRKVDYIILYISNSIREVPHPTVIAVRTGNVRKHLKRQGITVYKYIGEDSYDTTPLHFNDAKITPMDDDENGYNLTIGWNRKNSETVTNAVFSAFGEAYHAKKKNIPFATTRIVQLLLFSISEDIECIYRDGLQTRIEFKGGKMDRTKLNERYQKFDQIYGRIEASNVE